MYEYMYKRKRIIFRSPLSPCADFNGTTKSIILRLRLYLSLDIFLCEVVLPSYPVLYIYLTAIFTLRTPIFPNDEELLVIFYIYRRYINLFYEVATR